MFQYARHMTALNSGTMTDCADAITAAQAAMPTNDYVARSLRDNAVPVNEIIQLEGIAEVIVTACRRAQLLHTNERDAAIEAHRAKKRQR